MRNMVLRLVPYSIQMIQFQLLRNFIVFRTYFLRYWAFQVFWKLQGAWFKKKRKKPHAKADTSSTFVTFQHFLFHQITFYARGPWFKSPSHPSINAQIIWRKCISHIRNPRKSKFHYCWGVLHVKSPGVFFARPGGPGPRWHYCWPTGLCNLIGHDSIRLEQFQSKLS